MDTVTLTIDGRQVTVEKGKTVLQAAIERGVSVPYYCYHPGIGVDGSCRVCVVKVEKMPKLQTSCATTCTGGMVVHTRTQEVVEARAGVFEFLLVNHPLELLGENGPNAVSVSWRSREKQQPAQTTFKVPAVDAPNVNGARMFGLVTGAVGDPVREADVAALRQAVEAGRVTALYVFDSGPDGSLGDMSWIVDARARGTLSVLIVQGVLMSPLARAADVVLPGASYVEKQASYTNEQGRLQGTSRVILPPGDAMEDWQILVAVGAALDVAFDYTSSGQVRTDIAARFSGIKELQGLPGLSFSRPLEAQHWLETSNPSERWKWDFMFQDLPPVKGDLDLTALPLPPGVIALKEVKG